MRPLRNPVIQAVLAWLLAGWMRFCFATIRWTHQNRGAAEAVWDAGGGVLCAFWHSRIGLSPACWPLGRAQAAKALISLSPDGQFIARAVALQGIPEVRGSSANKDKADRAKGGSQALRDGLRQLKVGALAITPDGPRGPAREMAEGLPLLARLSKAPVLFIARAVALQGIPAVRGSSANKDKADRAKGGSQALRDGLRQLKVGALAITPDGPRGPAREMAEGLPLLARLSKTPVLFIGLSCSPAIRLSSWDRALLPLPFARGAIVWDVAHYPEGAELADVALAWTERLNTVEAAADAITGLERI